MAKSKAVVNETTETPDTEQKPQLITFAEWKVEISTKVDHDTQKASRTYEKIKVLRPRVVITEREAEILNEGVLLGGNSTASMYFKNEPA